MTNLLIFWFIDLAVKALLLGVVNTSILQWRARKLQNWGISYKKAFYVSLKAGLVGLLSQSAIRFVIGFVGLENAEQEAAFLNLAGFLFLLSGWFFFHSSELIRLAGTSRSLSVSEARAISTSVFWYSVAACIVLAMVFNILHLTIFSFKSV